MSTKPADGKADVVESPAERMQRLCRDNRLLRLQVLKMQRERRRRQEADAATAAAIAPPAAAVPVSNGSASYDHNDALQLRIQMLQRQNEREKQRRAAAEKELRYEIELLRLALDEAESGGGGLGHKASTESTPLGGSSLTSPKRAQHVDPLSPPPRSATTVPVTSPTSDRPSLFKEEYNKIQQLYEKSLEKYEQQQQLQAPLVIGDEDTFQLPEDDLLQRTANKMAQRRARLERVDSNMGGYSSTTSLTSIETPRATPAPCPPGAYPHTSPVVPHADDALLSGTLKSRIGNGSSPNGSTNDDVGVPQPKSVFNPNQIGIEIKPDEKNRTWYVQRALALALLRFIPPIQRANAVVDQHETADSHVVVTTIDATNNSSLPCKPTALPADVDHSPLRKVSSSSDDESEDGAANSSGRNTPLPSLQNTFVFKGQNPIALRRAIEESFSLHVRCSHNEPVLIPWQNVPTEHFPHIEDENTDLTLLKAFALAKTVSDEAAAGGSGTNSATKDGRKKRKSDTDKKKHKKGDKGEFREDELRIVLHAPVVFSQVRDFLGLDLENFRRALESAVWRQSMSPGKSGTTLYYFGDYVMKTVHESEFQFYVQRFLPSYAEYCERNPHTMLPRFYALLSVVFLKLGTTKRFVLMHNVFATSYYIHRIYDVKGSTVGRTALKPGKPAPRTAFGALLLKDNDLPPQLIICGSYQRAIILAQFRSDVDFLHALNIVDYSCMIGVRSRVFTREEGPSQTIFLRRRKNDKTQGSHSIIEEHVTTLQTLEGGGVDEVRIGTLPPETDPMASPSCAGEHHHRHHHFGESAEDGYVCIHGCDGGLLSLPIYAPGDDTTAREDVYYLGVIDVLQEYNSAKKLENFAKGFVNDRTQISVVPPKDYAERLYRSLERITV